MRQNQDVNQWRLQPLDQAGRLACRIDANARLSLRSPSIQVLAKGRILVSFEEAGPGVKHLSGRKGKNVLSGHYAQSRIFSSDDDGETFEPRSELPFGNGRLFRDGSTLYLLGHSGNLRIATSRDGGVHWEGPSDLTSAGGELNRFELGPASLWQHDSELVGVAQSVADPDCKGNRASVYEPVLFAARSGGSLNRGKDWTFSPGGSCFRDMIPDSAGEYTGIPEYNVPRPDRGVDLDKGRWVNRIGWRHLHALRITDPEHAWFDPGGNTFHLLGAAYSHRANMGVLLRAERSAGRFKLALQQTAAGHPWFWLPLPGGQACFDVFWDTESARYWLVSTPGTDSLRSLSAMHGRAGIPAGISDRLQVYTSRNLVDWELAACLACGLSVRDPACAVRNHDLYVVTREGAVDVNQPGNTLEVRVRQVPQFRSLLC